MKRFLLACTLILAFFTMAQAADDRGKTYQIYDNNWNRTGYIKEGRVYDKDWQPQGYVRENRPSDKDLQQKGQYKDDLKR